MSMVMDSNKAFDYVVELTGVQEGTPQYAVKRVDRLSGERSWYDGKTGSWVSYEVWTQLTTGED